jgi:hypothetical protein
LPEGEPAQGELQEIPFACYSTIEDGAEESLARDSTQNNDEWLNLKSAEDFIDYFQAYQRIGVAGANDDEVKQWAANMCAIFSDSRAKILTIPEVKNALRDKRKSLEQSNQREALLEHQQLADDSRQTQSVESKEADREARKKYYLRIVKKVETVVNQTMKLIAQFEGLDAELVNIQLGTKFNLKSTEEQLTEDSVVWGWAGQAGTAGQAIKKEILKRYVADMDIVAEGPDEEETRKSELIEAIEAEDLSARSGSRLRLLTNDLQREAA